MLTIREKLLVTMVLSTAIMTGAGIAHAQQPQQGMPGQGQHMMGYPMMGGMMGNMPMMGHMGMMSGMMSGPIFQGRLAYVKAELGITEAQSAAWKGYTDAVNDRMTAMLSMHQSMMQTMQSGTALERMNAHMQAMQAMTEALKALKPVTETLYAVLTPEQKKKGDLLLSMGCMM